MSCEICGKRFNILDIHRRFCEKCIDAKQAEAEAKAEAEDRCPKCGLVGATMKHVVHCDGIIPVVTPKQPDNAHYTGGIEPWEYIRANKLDFFEGNVVKYVTRWRKKGGVEDLRKAKVYIEELIRQQETT